MTPFSRRKQSEPVDPPQLFSPMHAPCFPCTKNIAENPCRSAENCALQYSQIPTTGILAPRLTILRLRFGMVILLTDQHWAELFAVVSSRMPRQRSFPTRLQLQIPLVDFNLHPYRSFVLLGPA
jgi:hypothetical protein